MEVTVVTLASYFSIRVGNYLWFGQLNLNGIFLLCAAFIPNRWPLVMTCICEATHFNLMYTWMCIAYTITFFLLNLRIRSFHELLYFGFTSIYLSYALYALERKLSFYLFVWFWYWIHKIYEIAKRYETVEYVHLVVLTKMKTNHHVFTTSSHSPAPLHHRHSPSQCSVATSGVAQGTVCSATTKTDHLLWTSSTHRHPYASQRGRQEYCRQTRPILIISRSSVPVKPLSQNSALPNSQNYKPLAL